MAEVRLQGGKAMLTKFEVEKPFPVPAPDKGTARDQVALKACRGQFCSGKFTTTKRRILTKEEGESG